MGNFKVKVNSEAESREVQDLFLELGYAKGACSEGNYPADIIAVPRGFFSETPFSSRSIKLDHEEHEGYKELTLPELRDLVERKEMKEYLNRPVGRCEQLPEKRYLQKMPDGTYVEKAGRCLSVPDGWIEIPEGAEIAIQFKNDPDTHGIIFYKNGGKSCMGKNDNNWQHDSEWTMDQLLNENFHDGAINLSHYVLWQRTASLNDQYAEIEQVRQDHLTLSNVDNTLADRQSQYGEFKDVADTTTVFMDQFALGRMSYVQREALHMICSKLARIANGDPNHIDSWHDIAGYATLVVNDLES